MLRVKPVYSEKRIDFKEIVCDFSVPVELKNDIMYCQKYMKIYLKVFKALMERDGAETDPYMPAFLEDIQFNIYEINAEQRYAIVRLKRVLEIYYLSMARVGMHFDHNTQNEHISETLKELYNDETFVCQPCRVRKRPSEDEIYRSYNLPWKGPITPEYIVPRIIIGSSMSMSTPPPPPPAPAEVTVPKNTSQVSLLKPKSERISLNTDLQKLLKEPAVDPPVPSSSVNRSRLNLREALNKARTEAAAMQQQQHKEIAKKEAQQHKPVATVTSSATTKPTKQTETKKTKAQPKPNVSSSSEDSYDTREISPALEIPASMEPTHPQELSQEMFLQMFDLYPPDFITYMQQRRSKRRRRNVQSNERTDYHYGHITFDNSLPSMGDRKRRKTLLLSPPSVKRKVQVDNSNAVDADHSSRSSSSSPVQKEICNECMKQEGSVNSCKQCNGFFHEKCHGKTDATMKSTFCPSCLRENKSNNANNSDICANKPVQTTALIGQYKNLNIKCHRAADRHKSLLQQSLQYKREMKHLLNIVETMKTE